MYGSNFWREILYPCPSSSAPIDAAASPLPSDDTTPPVTKMYLVAFIREFRGTCERCRSIRTSGLEQPTHLFEIFRRVHANRVVRGFHGLDANAVFERAQLFQRLGAFERGRLERGEHHQRGAAIRVHADVTEQRRIAAARVARVR